MGYSEKKYVRISLLLVLLSSTLISLLFNVFIYGLSYPVVTKAGPNDSPILIIKKVTYGGNGDFGFTIYLGGAGMSSATGSGNAIGTAISTSDAGAFLQYPGTGGGMTSNPISLSAGSTVSIVENIPPGWRLQNAFCTVKRPVDALPQIINFYGGGPSALTSSGVTMSGNTNVVTIAHGYVQTGNVINCTFVNLKLSENGTWPPAPYATSLGYPNGYLPPPNLTTLEQLASDAFTLGGIPISSSVANSNLNYATGFTQVGGPAFGLPGDSVTTPLKILLPGQSPISSTFVYVIFPLNVIKTLLVYYANPNPELYAVVWDPIVNPPLPVVTDINAGEPAIGGADLPSDVGAGEPSGTGGDWGGPPNPTQ